MMSAAITPMTEPCCWDACACAGSQGIVEANRLARDLALERSHALLRQVDQARELFTRIVLRGDPVETLTAAAEELLARPVEIMDGGAPSGATDFPIEAADRSLGVVRIGPGPAPLSDGEEAIARQVAIAAAMLLLTAGSPRLANSRAEAAERRPSADDDDGWADLWIAELPRVAEQAYLVIAMSVEAGGDEGPAEAAAVTAHAIDRALQGRRVTAFVGASGPDHVIVAPVSDRGRATSLGRTLVEHIGSLVRLAGPRFVISTGLTGLAHDASGLPRRVREARLAARLGRLLNGPDAVTSFRDLRAFPAMLEAVRDGATAFDDLHERYVGSLVSYEARTRLPLMETLSVLFDENGNVSGAARALGINRQSLLYRLRKIETMCEIDLADPADRFALELAVRSWMVRETVVRGRGGRAVGRDRLAAMRMASGIRIAAG